MRQFAKIGQRLFVAAIGGAIAVGAIAHHSTAEAAQLRPCPWSGVQCLDVWDPVIAEWTSILEDLATDPGTCADRLDWVAKRHLLDAYDKAHPRSGSRRG